MYRVNRLPRHTVIVTDEVIAMGSVSNNPDINILLNAIIVAEERFLKPAMGDAFYYAFRDAKNKTVTSDNVADLTTKINIGNTGEPIILSVGETVNALEFVEDDWQVKWWKEFGWSIAAESVVFISTPQNYMRHEASGEIINNPKTISMGDSSTKGAQSGELKDVQWKLNKIHQDRIDPLIEASHKWLCSNIANFSIYTKDCGNCGFGSASGISVKRKTGFIHGIYDNDRGEGCCN